MLSYLHVYLRTYVPHNVHVYICNYICNYITKVAIDEVLDEALDEALDSEEVDEQVPWYFASAMFSSTVGSSSGKDSHSHLSALRFLLDGDIADAIILSIAPDLNLCKNCRPEQFWVSVQFFNDKRRLFPLSRRKVVIKSDKSRTRTKSRTVGQMSDWQLKSDTVRVGRAESDCPTFVRLGPQP